MDSTEFSMKLGEWLAPVIIIVIGYAVARRINKDREFDNQVKWPIVTGFVVGGLMLVSQCSRTPASDMAGMSAIERQKRASGDIVGNISFDRNIEPTAEPLPLPLDQESLATIDREAASLLSAELPKRGIEIAGPLTAVSKNMTFKGEKFYQTLVQGELKGGQGSIYMLVTTGSLEKGAGSLSCTSLDGRPFEFLNSPCSDEASKFFELSGSKS